MMECISIVKILWIFAAYSLLSNKLLIYGTCNVHSNDLGATKWPIDAINYMNQFKNRPDTNGGAYAGLHNKIVANGGTDRIETLMYAQYGKLIDGIWHPDQHSIDGTIYFIDDAYAEIMRDTYDGDGPSNETLLSTAIGTTSNMMGSVRSELRQLVHELILHKTNYEENSIWKKDFEFVLLKLAAGQWCDNARSFNEYISHRYRIFANTIMKGYILVVGSYMVRRSLGEMNTEGSMRQMVSEYYSSMQQIDDKIQSLMAQSSVSVRRCDPLKHERGKTYIEFEKLIQGYLAHKLNLDVRNSVHISCENLNATEKHPIKFREKEEFTFFAHTTCSGSIFDCWAGRVGSICSATSPSRRYDGFTYLSDWTLSSREFGNMIPCEGHVRNRPTNFNAEYTAESCGCLCDDTNDLSSFRKINQHPVWSHYENNMVATGFRLVNDSNTLYLEIKQGKLEEYGFINRSSNEWRPREQYITSKSYSSPIQLSKDLRSINLNIATVPLGLAIIGAVFTVAPGIDDQPNIIELGIFTVPVSYATGKLLDPIENLRYDQPKRPKSELKIREPTIPTLAAINKLNMGEDKFIKLQPSDWKKDAAQTVVPFLDIQEVVTDPPTLLGGLGFSYRSADGYGGFIGLELQTWNYTRILFGPSYNETEFVKNDGFSRN